MKAKIGSRGRVPIKGARTGRFGLIGSKCYKCGEPATQFVDIQYSWFRGEDEVFTTCNKHIIHELRDLEVKDADL